MVKDKNLERMTKAQLIQELKQLQYNQILFDSTETIAHIGHCVWNFRLNQIVSCSEEYARIYNMSVEEVTALQQDWERSMQQIHPDDRERYQDSYKSIEVHKTHDIEYRIIRNDGKIRHLREIVVLSPGAEGFEQDTLALLQDITDVRLAEIELRTAKEAAEDANKAKSEFLSRMSHELRTPMNAVLGFGQILEGDVMLNEEQQIHVGYILSAGAHLMALINEVLELENVNSGRTELFMEAVNSGEVLQECVNLIKSLAEKHHVTIEISVTPNSAPTVWADEIRLKQVLLNLLSNGIKYNREGGRVTVRVEDNGEGMLRISISDTGQGIPEENIGELFEPFSRLGAEKGDVEGTGIGLTITKHLVQLMGGEIGVETTLGDGSTFWVELRLDQNMERD